MGLFDLSEHCSQFFHSEFWNFDFLGNYGLFKVKNRDFTQNASSLSFLDRFQFEWVYLIRLSTVHNSSIRNFRILTLWENMGLFGVKNRNSTQNTSSLLFLDRIQFQWVCLIWLCTVHNSSIQNFEILIFGENMDFLRKKIGISHKMLLLFHILTDFNLNGFVWFVWALFTIILPFRILKFGFF